MIRYVTIMLKCITHRDPLGSSTIHPHLTPKPNIIKVGNGPTEEVLPPDTMITIVEIGHIGD